MRRALAKTCERAVRHSAACAAGSLTSGCNRESKPVKSAAGALCIADPTPVRAALCCVICRALRDMENQHAQHHIWVPQTAPYQALLADIASLKEQLQARQRDIESLGRERDQAEQHCANHNILTKASLRAHASSPNTHTHTRTHTIYECFTSPSTRGGT